MNTTVRVSGTTTPAFWLGRPRATYTERFAAPVVEPDTTQAAVGAA